MTGRPVVIVDVETTGLDPQRDQIWELAVIVLGEQRRDFAVFVEHDERLADGLPEPFREDHHRRYRAALPGTVHSFKDVRRALAGVMVKRPTLVGAQPWFDAAFLAQIFPDRPWHYRLRCVESMTAGHLGRDVGGLDDCLAALDLAPNNHPHHAYSDAVSALRIWQYLNTTTE